MKPIEVKREVLRFVNGHAEKVEDSIVTEYPVTVKINGQEFVTMVCTPEFIEDMVIGFFWRLKGLSGNTRILTKYGYKKEKALST